MLAPTSLTLVAPSGIPAETYALCFKADPVTNDSNCRFTPQYAGTSRYTKSCWCPRWFPTLDSSKSATPLRGAPNDKVLFKTDRLDKVGT